MSTPAVAIRSITFSISLLALISLAGRAAADETPAGLDLVIAWDTTAIPLLQPEELAELFGVLRTEDRLGWILSGKEAAPLSGFDEGGAKTAAFELATIAKDAPDVETWRDNLGPALDLLEGKRSPKRLAAVIVVGAKDEEADAGPASEDLLSRLLMAEIAVHGISRTTSASLSSTAASTGGKLITIAEGAPVLPALHVLYDSLQLRAVELSKDKSTEKESEVDYAYLDEKVDTPDEAVALKEAAEKRPIVVEGGTGPAVYILLALLFLVNVGAVLLVLVRTKPPAPTKQSDKEKKIHESPSFSRLTMGLNHFRTSFNDADKRLEALALDLEDYGIESWDMEKKLLEEYVTLTKGIFLLLDHFELSGEEGAKGLTRKIMRLLDDAGIESFAPDKGERFDGKRHIHGGERPDSSPPGTILEVARKGYTKAKGLLHGEPLILRQAEVILSAGEDSNKGDDE